MLRYNLRLLHNLFLSSICTAVMASSETASNSANYKPKLIVFDLDYTLWPFWVDTHVDPPFKKEKNGLVYDAHMREVQFYPDVPEVLAELHSQGYKLGIASRTTCKPEADDLTKLFNWDRFFSYREIYPGSKTNHFKKLHKDTGFAYEDMIFFDDEHRNIVEVGRMGVLCIFVDNGVTKAVVREAFKEFGRTQLRQSTSAKKKRTLTTDFV